MEFVVWSDEKVKNSGLFLTDVSFWFFRLAKLMKSLARWEITLSALICLIPLRPNLSKKTKHFTLTLPNSYLSKCFFLVETKNVSVQIFNIFFVFRLFFWKCKKKYLKSVCNKVNLFSFCRLKWLHLEKCSRNEFFPSILDITKYCSVTA